MANTTDSLGEALKDYWFNQVKDGEILIQSDIIDDDLMPVHLFFREHETMPALEQKALSLATGKVLDIGAGAGCHATYLTKQGIETIGLDISPGACKVMQDQGLDYLAGNLFELTPTPTFNTILLLMNGIGICGSLSKLPSLLDTLEKWLAPGGKILFDSSDVSYLFQDEDGASWINLNQAYMGDFMFSMSYQNNKSEDFEWTYIDFDSVKEVATKNGWHIELIEEGPHYDYLASLSKNG
jgi:2-polyprenyl-3-methyl-5-hydroxy-6-metoxy-1,4-benzoquinol methylase